MLSAFAGPAVVGWFAASRTLFGAIISPAGLLVSAAFPQLSRNSESLPDLRRTIDTTARVISIAAAFSCSALYLFADQMVAIIYGHGRFEQTAAILRVSAIFIPLLFFGYLLTTAMDLNVDIPVLWRSLISETGQSGQPYSEAMLSSVSQRLRK